MEKEKTRAERAGRLAVELWPMLVAMLGGWAAALVIWAVLL